MQNQFCRKFKTLTFLIKQRLAVSLQKTPWHLFSDDCTQPNDVNNAKHKVLQKEWLSLRGHTETVAVARILFLF